MGDVLSAVKLHMDNQKSTAHIKQLYRVIQIIGAATDGCRSQPYLACQPASGMLYWRLSPTRIHVSIGGLRLQQ